jgi:AcrR family transcriptional regulator
VITKRAPSRAASAPQSRDDVAPPLRQVALAEFAHHLDADDWTGLTSSKRRVLEAYLELCVRHGFNAVSMRTLAAELQIKAPSLYSHFAGGRDEIVEESLRWHFHRFATALIQAVADTTSADQFWDAMVKVHFTRQVQLAESNMWDLLVATDRMAHVLPTQLSKQVGHWIDLYEALYVAAAHDMGFADAERRVKVVMTILEGATRWFDAQNDDRSLGLAANQAVLLSREILHLAL